MSHAQPKLRKDPEDVVKKFAELIERARPLVELTDPAKIETMEPQHHADLLIRFREIRASALNLLARLSFNDSIYFSELSEAGLRDPLSLLGILIAASNDYRQGFLVDHRLLISGEVFSDLLVQAEVLLEHDYHDAAAVLTSAVLEDALRKLASANKIDLEKRGTLQQTNEKLYKAKLYNAVLHKEIIAKAEIGNCAAHGKFDQYKKGDVAAFLEFVQRFLAQYLS